MPNSGVHFMKGKTTKTWVNGTTIAINFTNFSYEREFSTMNCISSSVLTQEHLNACMSIALCGYTIETFPFERC